MFTNHYMNLPKKLIKCHLSVVDLSSISYISMVLSWYPAWFLNSVSLSSSYPTSSSFFCLNFYLCIRIQCFFCFNTLLRWWISIPLCQVHWVPVWNFQNILWGNHGYFRRGCYGLDFIFSLFLIHCITALCIIMVLNCLCKIFLVVCSHRKL